LKIRI